MAGLLGSRELRIVLPSGQAERIPHALIQLAYTSLPDSAEQLRATLKQWTDGGLVSDQALDATERDLLDVAHAHTDESGLLNKIALRSVGQLVDPGNLPEDWPQVHALTVLALAIRRFHLLSQCLGATVGTVDQDEPEK